MKPLILAILMREIGGHPAWHGRIADAIIAAMKEKIDGAIS